MAAERWIFTRSQLENTPSRRCGIDSDKELNYRQNTANFIQDMGQKLQVYPSLNNQLLKIGVTSCVHSFFEKHFRRPECVFILPQRNVYGKLKYVLRDLEVFMRCLDTS